MEDLRIRRSGPREAEETAREDRGGGSSFAQAPPKPCLRSHAFDKAATPKSTRLGSYLLALEPGRYCCLIGKSSSFGVYGTGTQRVGVEIS